MKTAISGLLFATAMISANLTTSTCAAPLDDKEIQARADEAKVVSSDFLKKLGETMKAEMQAGGPTAAMQVCRDVAPGIANDVSLKNGWQVTRVGTRVRNPMLGLPDSWEQSVLQDFHKRATQGEPFDDMTHFEVVEEPAGKSLRFMKAIGIAPQCIVCHGRTEQIAEPVRSILNKLYPHDRAVNYKPGDLRGAVSIKQPLMD